MSSLHAELHGAAALLRKLKDIDKRAGNKAARKGLGNAGNVVLRAMKAKVPVGTGSLKRSLGRKVSRKKRLGGLASIIGSRVGEVAGTGKWKSKRRDGKLAAGSVKPHKYAHLVELGHGGPHPAPPHPFMRPAYDESRSAIMAAIIEAIRQELH